MSKERESFWLECRDKLRRTKFGNNEKWVENEIQKAQFLSEDLEELQIIGFKDTYEFLDHFSETIDKAIVEK